MNDNSVAFLVGVVLMFCAGMILLAVRDPWSNGYCAAACGSAGVVEVSAKVCTCGPEDAPAAVKIREGR